MKNKKILLVLLLIMSITIVFITIFITKNNNNINSKIKKGYEIFGNDYCKGHDQFETVGHAFTSWTCAICGYSGIHHNTGTPTICHECANVTGRCSECGKLHNH